MRGAVGSRVKPAWLSRSLTVGPYLTLCTSEQEFERVLRHLKVPAKDRPAWMSDTAGGMTVELAAPKGGHACVVCLREDAARSPLRTAAILVHEAVHVWQGHCSYIGEDKPSAEFEAYAIESISLALMQEYASRLEKGKV